MGIGFSCLLVIDASSNAAKRPIIVTKSAANLAIKVIVRIGVLSGVTFKLMIKPAMMLPQARRLIGLIIKGLFSLIGLSGLNRGCFIDTKKIIRRL